MSYLFTCSHCQTKTLVDDQYSGQTGQCVTCGAEIQLPDFAPQQAAREPSSAGSPSNPQAPWQSAGQSPLLRRLVAAAVLLVVIFCGAVALVRYGGPAVSSIQTNRVRTQGVRNVERIVAALNAYAADHGTYPPPLVRRADGTTMHSWRVLILPYLDQQLLFDDYDMNQPWDSPQNYELAARVPAVYRSVQSSGYGTTTAYFLITGPGTLFPPAPPGDPASAFRPLGPRSVTDDPAQTLLVVEAELAPSGFTVWTEPTDLDVTTMQGVIGSNPGREIGGITSGGAIVATVDGRGHFLSDQTSPATVMALITIAGGEPLPDDVLD